MTTAAALPPLDPNAAQTADAEQWRREQYLRKALAEGRASPSRLRLIKNELHDLEQGRARGVPPR